MSSILLNSLINNQNESNNNNYIYLCEKKDNSNKYNCSIIDSYVKSKNNYDNYNSYNNKKEQKCENNIEQNKITYHTTIPISKMIPFYFHHHILEHKLSKLFISVVIEK